MTFRVMVVDDDAAIRETLADFFRSRGLETAEAAGAEQALARVADFQPDLLLTDVRMEGMDGLALLGLLRERAPDVDVVVITAFEDMQTAISAMKAGACDYLVKPLDLDHIDVVADRCLSARKLRRRAHRMAEEAAEPYAMSHLVGRDARMIEIYKQIGMLARTRAPVLIRGETGTGKELIARAIHFNSAEAGEPFVAVNCTAVPESLLESELFGHVRGAFTSAVADRRGRFEMAGRGTIFLDEIGDTTPAFQAKLLRVLQDREFHPVGSEAARRTEARVIAATHRPLEQMVRDGSFRQDLYFRLRVVEITVPPLRERRGDIPLLAESLAARAARELHRGAELSPGAVRALQGHDWPGNVRELENTLARAVALSTSAVITERDVNLTPAALPPGGEAALDDRTLDAVERAHVERVLRGCGGNKRRAARVLGVSRPRLDRLLEKYGMVVTERDQR